MKSAGYLLLSVGFIVGSVAAVLDPAHIDLTLFVLGVSFMAVGVGLARFAERRASRDTSRLEKSFEVIDRALVALAERAASLDAEKETIDIYDLPGRIDERFAHPVESFVQARESIRHIWGAQAFADVMAPFAAGERFLNRAWATAVDGYIDEAHASLARAREELEAARLAFEALPHERRAGGGASSGSDTQGEE